MTSSSPADFPANNKNIPCSSPANEWSVLEKALFRFILAGPKQEWVLENLSTDFVLFHDRKKPREEYLFIKYSPDDQEKLQQLFWRAIAPNAPKMHLNFVLFGGGEEAAKLLVPPPGPSYWAKTQIIHVDEKQQCNLLNGRDDGYLLPILQTNGKTLSPTYTEVLVFKQLIAEGVKRWLDQRISLQEFQIGLSMHHPYVTYALLALLLIYAALTMMLGGFENTPALVRLGALVPGMIRSGEWWRLVTTGFLHGGVFHLICNGYALYILGTQLERILGNWRFLLLYLFSLLGGSLASTHFGGDHYSVGASGAIWGLMCAEAVMLFWPRGLLPQHFAQAAKNGMLSCLLINVAISFMPGIDMSAHLGGGVAGAVLMGSGILNLGLKRLGGKKNPHNGLANLCFSISGGICIAFMAVALIIGFRITKPFELKNPPQLVNTTAFDHVINLPKINNMPFEMGDGVLSGGNLLADSGSFELLAKELPARPTAEDTRELLESLKLQAQLPAEGMKPQLREIREIGQTQTLLLFYSSDNLTVRRYFWVSGQTLWRFDLLIRNVYLHNYAGIAEQVIRSAK